MKDIVETGLPALKQPLSWALHAAGLLRTAPGPVRPAEEEAA